MVGDCQPKSRRRRGLSIIKDSSRRCRKITDRSCQVLNNVVVAYCLVRPSYLECRHNQPHPGPLVTIIFSAPSDTVRKGESHETSPSDPCGHRRRPSIRLHRPATPARSQTRAAVESASGEHNSVSEPDEGSGESESSDRRIESESGEGRSGVRSRVNTIVYRSQARAEVNQSQANTVVNPSQMSTVVNRSQAKAVKSPALSSR